MDELVSLRWYVKLSVFIVDSHQQSSDGRVNGRNTSVAFEDDEARKSISCRVDSRESLRPTRSMSNMSADSTGPSHDNDKVL